MLDDAELEKFGFRRTIAARGAFNFVVMDHVPDLKVSPQAFGIFPIGGSNGSTFKKIRDATSRIIGTARGASLCVRRA